ncbi:MAG: TetR family transcriptional regulator [Acidobacteria bacterium]|nr:TetR family transcriptional regulator [Acidobacteriota bacterium]
MKTKDKILKAARVLFAEKGFREVTVREIAARAGVNSALVGYHFGNKQELFDEVYRSYSEPLARERMKRLTELAESKKKPSVEDVLKAWLLPLLQAGDDPRQRAFNVRFTANVAVERWKYTKKPAQFAQQAHNVFIDALHRCLPHISRDTLRWRLHFIVGAIAFGIRVPGPLRAFSKGRCDPDDLETTLAQIIPFAVKGFRSPEPE